MSVPVKHKRKVCPRCGKEKALASRFFVFTTDRATGQRRWKHCRVCDRKRQRAKRAEVMADPERADHLRAMKRAQMKRQWAENPEPLRKAQRDWRAQLKINDPEHYAEIFLIPRRFRVEGRPRNVANATKFEPHRAPSKHELLPVAPLAAFLHVAYPGWAAGDILAITGDCISMRWLGNVLEGEAEMVELDAADRLLTRGLGRPDLLNQLYPFDGRTL